VKDPEIQSRPGRCGLENNMFPQPGPETRPAIARCYSYWAIRLLFMAILRANSFLFPMRLEGLLSSRKLLDCFLNQLHSAHIFTKLIARLAPPIYIVCHKTSFVCSQLDTYLMNISFPLRATYPNHLMCFSGQKKTSSTPQILFSSFLARLMTHNED
jgi:hypothetical protein